MSSKKEKASDIISAFLNLMNSATKEYEVAESYTTEMDKELQDLVHKAELTQLKQGEKAKLMTELQKNRRERRYWKDKKDAYLPLHELITTSPEFKRAIEQLKQALGKVRKAEDYLSNRHYIPKAKKNQK